MIAPDFLRVVQPAGFVRYGDQWRRADLRRPGPVRGASRNSPAWRAGIRVGDQARSCRDALHPGRYRPMRQHSVAIWRGELRRAGPRSEAHPRRDGRAPGARSHGGCGAAPRQSSVRGDRGARHDRRHPGGAWRGMAGVDASRGHDLGLLHLCDSIQSRPGVSSSGPGFSFGRRRSWRKTPFRRLCRPPPIPGSCSLR